MRKSLKDRFWARVDKSGGRDACWPWTGAVTHSGYGDFSTGTFRRAHRAAYFFTSGAIPDGLCVCHACDNRRCCNPAHLWLGTQADNVSDMYAKGRRNGFKYKARAPKDIARGEDHPCAKLDLAKVLIIRELPGTCASVGAMFGVSESQVHRIRKRQAWAHV